MARSRNLVLLKGNLIADPKQFSGEEKALAVSFAIATNEYAGKDKEEHTEIHNCVAFTHNAEYILKYAKKGSKVDLEGRLRSSVATKESGDQRYVNIHIEEIEIITPASSKESA